MCCHGEHQLRQLMSKPRLRAIADANTDCAVKPALTPGCLMFSVVQPHSKAHQQILQHFGTEILLENGEINREALGNIIFSQPEKRRLLNSITHPEILKEMLKQVLKYFVLGKRPCPVCRDSCLGRSHPCSLYLWFECGERNRDNREREGTLSDSLCALPPVAFGVCLEDSFLIHSCLSLLPFTAFLCGLKCICRAWEQLC